ncbi:MAG: cytochrome C [Epsilonproteobacteria bacterium]|nr:cytochrome C [Campylobacterota bacterium]
MSRYIILFMFGVLSLDAAVYKGQQVFMRECMQCHEVCQEFVAKKTQVEWLAFFKEKGLPLAQLHLKNEKAKKSWKYFKSKKYIKKSKHLKQFLVEYAKDSEKVPACN